MPKEHVDEATEHPAPAAPPPVPASPQRTALASALRNAGMTAEQAEAVVKALEDFLHG
jgi:hypothetical protein